MLLKLDIFFVDQFDTNGDWEVNFIFEGLKMLSIGSERGTISKIQTCNKV